MLAAQLAEGRSIESIAREAGRAAVDGGVLGQQARPDVRSTPHATRRAAASSATSSQALLEEGLSIRAMAERLGVSYTTVRHWLRRHELDDAAWASAGRDRAGPRRGAETTEAHCPVHGVTTFVRRGHDGFRCRLCRTGAVHRRRREVKRVLVEEAGGACVLCGYDRSLAGLHFHHLDPAEKSFALSRQRRDALAGRGSCRGREVRAAVLELPCGSRGRDCATARVATTMRASRPQAAHSGVAQSAEHSAVNRRVVGSSPTPRASEARSSAGLARARHGARAARCGAGDVGARASTPSPAVARVDCVALTPCGDLARRSRPRADGARDLRPRAARPVAAQRSSWVAAAVGPGCAAAQRATRPRARAATGCAARAGPRAARPTACRSAARAARRRPPSRPARRSRPCRPPAGQTSTGQPLASARASVPCPPWVTTRSQRGIVSA